MNIIVFEQERYLQLSYDVAMELVESRRIYGINYTGHFDGICGLDDCESIIDAYSEGLTLVMKL